MPQMCPMWWAIMLFFFIKMYVIFNTINFFTLSYTPQSLEMKKNLIMIMKMMTNLFSFFDPSASLGLPLNWMSTTIIGIIIIPSSFRLIPSRINLIWNKIILTLHKEFKTLLGPYSTGSTQLYSMTS